MYERILVAIGVIFLIFFIVKFCEKEPSEPSSFDSIYEESQEETSTYDNSDSAVTRKREYSFPEYNSDTDEIDDEYEGGIMTTMIPIGLTITMKTTAIMTFREMLLAK